ncbi:MAG: Gfo/Idh/MocA family oxidoreductase [Thermomicrobium sp.]|nr:Gfo/Idh/MocA family oxidoreductase [Thermomicrobium sp.]MDW8060225.1 Gfo/Idh/MocA family oxidoreductase [Thermomicrobium sp.]
MQRPVDAVLVGAGNRGTLAYGTYALRAPWDLRFVAVAEPNDERRARFARQHDIPPERQFRSWQELAEQPQLAPALINATMDRDHFASTIAFLEKGYHILLEKPMATTPEHCLALAATAERTGRILQVAHVLRYAPFFRTIHDLVRDGRLGEIVSVDWRENLSYFHFAHSFVRGNWANTERSSPMILTKCCHDLDLLVWILDRACQRVASFGSLTHFTPEKAPPGAPARCTDGCPSADECPYFAPRIYLFTAAGSSFQHAVSPDPDPEAILSALATGPYGRCVYRCDNTAVDHQVVMMEFAGQLAVSLTMQGASHVEGRTVRIDGTRATLLANESRRELVIADHLTGNVETIRLAPPIGGHGGGDVGLIRGFVQSVRGERSDVLTSARQAVESHLLAFAAEEARVSGRIIDLADYRAQLERRHVDSRA